MFISATACSMKEIDLREKLGKKLLCFGIDYLDDALKGIFPDDLILIGAQSGIGKTQICCNIALANMRNGKDVHYFALEASEFEIERRLKYTLVMNEFFNDSGRPKIPFVSYTDWLSGIYFLHEKFNSYEISAAEKFNETYKNLYIYNKQDKFGISELISSVLMISKTTDLIIIDHAHYFDFDDDNENRSIKELAKTIRHLAIEEQTPIILIAHLRKKDRGNDDLIPGIEEFHGSSDLYKIASRVITIAPGRPTDDGMYETYFRVAKNRLDGGTTRYSAVEYYNPKTGGYEHERYKLGWSEQSRKNGFVELEWTNYPGWARIKPNSDVRNYNPRVVTKPAWKNYATD